MVSHIHIASCLVITLTLTSFFFLCHLTLSEHEYLMEESRLRFTCFIIIHLYIIVMMVIFIMIQQTYSFVKWGFILSIVVACLGTAVEIILSLHRIHRNSIIVRTVMPTELAYLNCYFLVYMYSLICCFLTGTYLLLTECCIWLQQYQIRRAISESIHTVAFTKEMADKECSICITHLKNGEDLLEIKCKHVFHQQCLLEWIRINQTCPTCRFDVFEQLNRDEVGVEIVQDQPPPNPNAPHFL